MQARGSLGTRLTIFASLCASTMRQGEGLERGKFLIVLYRLADARHFPRRGKQGESAADNFIRTGGRLGRRK